MGADVFLVFPVVCTGGARVPTAKVPSVLALLLLWDGVVRGAVLVLPPVGWGVPPYSK